MPNLNWSELSPLQLGRYAEYYAKMEFASYGFEVYTSEVDDHGVDFVVKVPGTANFYEVQVKSVRDFGYVFISKSKMPVLTAHRLVCHMHFIDGQLPDVFVIPATAWAEPNAVLVERNYRITITMLICAFLSILIQTRGGCISMGRGCKF